MILDEILAAKRQELAAAKRLVPVDELRHRPEYAEPRRGFAARLRHGAPAIIAEVKKASPSKGVIRADFDPVAIARAYERAGAAALSVLTEERFFQGKLDYLLAIRRAVALPLLRKDFLFDPYQLEEARAWGADAVLLIVAALPGDLLGEMVASAGEVGLDALVEVHTRDEMERATAARAMLIGINNRNLHTFETTLRTAEELRPLVPAGAVAVAESGIETAADVSRLRAARFSVFLVGETLMRAADPGERLRELLGAS